MVHSDNMKHKNVIRFKRLLRLARNKKMILEQLNILSSQLEALANTDITKAKKVNEKDFCYRLVICYEEKDKYINYKVVSDLLEQLASQEAIAYNTDYSEQEQEEAKKQVEAIAKKLEEAKKELKQKEEYTLTMKLVSMLDRLLFDYSIKANKYAYLMHKTDFKDNMQLFNKLQKIDNKSGQFKNTINFKNIKQVYNTIYLFLLSFNSFIPTEEKTRKKHCLYCFKLILIMIY